MPACRSGCPRVSLRREPPRPGLARLVDLRPPRLLGRLLASRHGRFLRAGRGEPCRGAAVPSGTPARLPRRARAARAAHHGGGALRGARRALRGAGGGGRLTRLRPRADADSERWSLCLPSRRAPPGAAERARARQCARRDGFPLSRTPRGSAERRWNAGGGTRTPARAGAGPSRWCGTIRRRGALPPTRSRSNITSFSGRWRPRCASRTSSAGCSVLPIPGIRRTCTWIWVPGLTSDSEGAAVAAHVSR
ncbi:MAG: hypothetical protein K0R38_2212 [Polyangiaceae bacterium]|nr:hypothetical protein [Polyangiaceae bacterium]